MQVTGNKSLTNNRLSIRIGAGGFSFVVTDASGCEEISREDFTIGDGETLLTALARVLGRPVLVKPEYSDVTLLSDSPSTRVPMEEFHSDEARAIFRLTLGMQDTGTNEVRYDVISQLEIVEIYTVDTQAEALVMRFYPQARSLGYYGNILSMVAEQERAADITTCRMHAVVEGDNLFIFQIHQGKLVYANSFKAQSSANRLFFLLSAWKMQELNQNTDVLVLHGKEDELRRKVALYIRNICA